MAIDTTSFRARLDAWRQREATEADVEAALANELSSDPRTATSTRALIEAYRRAGLVPTAFAERLLSVQPGRAAPPPADRTILRAARPATPAARAPDAAPPSPSPAPTPAPTPPADRTVLRLSRAAPSSPVPPPPPPEAAVAKTTFRMPAAPNAPEPAAAADAAKTGATGAGTGTGTSSWANIAPTGGTQRSSTEITIGSILAGQYEIEGIVPGGDKGGMGIVFRARDLVQVEAQDRNPYVAVKVLNEEFKRHPESMKALFSEYKKSQRLAHPNIVTVQHFNRDGGNFFMVMELLEGEPLSDVIRAVKDVGLPVAEALRIILGLSRALGYAHEKKVVHSDFKPSNAFRTHDGSIKVLDFGIARAAKARDGNTNTVADVRKQDATLFDAGTLGAFTPPYASCEQIGGMDPDPRDDVYALAVVSYELFTGRHPFDRKTAVEARDEPGGPLKPKRIPGLSRAQWRTLRNSLSFERDRRPPNAEAFADGLTPKATPIYLYAIGGAALLTVSIATVLLAPDIMQRRRADSLVVALASNDPNLQAQATDQLLHADPKVQAAVLSQAGVANEIVDIFKHQACLAFNPASICGNVSPTPKKYDYPKAVAALATAHKLLPDSASLLQVEESFASAQKQELTSLGEQFERLLANHQLLSAPGTPSLLDVRELIAHLDARNALLSDSRVPIAFRDAAAAALARADLDGAEGLVTAGLQLAPGDASLRDLSDSLQRQRDKARLASSIDDLERSLGNLGQAESTIADFRNALPQIERLQSVAPTDRVLSVAQARLRALVAASVTELLQGHGEGDDAQKGGTQAQGLLSEFQKELSAEFIQTQQAAISRRIGEVRARQLQAEQLRRDLDQLIAAPRVDDGWAIELRAAVTKLADIAPGDPKIQDAQNRGEKYLLKQAQDLRIAGRFSEADRVLNSADKIGVGQTDIKAERTALSLAREQQKADEAAKVANSQLAAKKARVLELAGAGGGRLDQALDLYNEVLKELPAGDTWGTVDAPRTLADGFLRRAAPLALAGNFTQAQSQAHKLLSLQLKDPNYKTQVDYYDELVTVQNELRSGPITNVKAAIEDLKRVNPRDYDAIESHLAAVITERIKATSDKDFDKADALYRDAKALMPLQRFVAPERKAVPLPPVALPSVPSTASPATPTNPAAGVPGNAPSVALTPAPPLATPERPAAAPLPAVAAQPEPVKQNLTPGGRACTSSLAGLGHNLRATCFDALAVGGQGPDLVVVSYGSKWFAMMRNETSAAEYARFCDATSCGKSVASSAMPMVSVSAADAQRYATWLSAQTGAHYRLPNDAEWKAAAVGIDGNDVNCVIGPRGSTPRDANIGGLSQFGLRNMLGNVREWVAADGGGWKARGGAYGDPMDDCVKVPTVMSSGAPDSRTGFRLLREITN